MADADHSGRRPCYQAPVMLTTSTVDDSLSTSIASTRPLSRSLSPRCPSLQVLQPERKLTMATTKNEQQRQQLQVSLGGQLDCSNKNNNHIDKPKPRRILASQSPRRRKILAMMGLTEGQEFLMKPSPLDKSKLQAASNVNDNNNNDNNKNDDHRLSPVKYNLRLA
eukprot:CAMPEP_0168172540 /NCGR_PEP_ID=MMETSP0139_2-20121125/5326_1 /TAXON_ID=44445 /ORGANISM="Pseudo-nitzschia australis, Strain 10249 10 AB" /LENGTH=165 /DNA_ID=CAMNT_0008090233 /DNA_START=69 /DNA_END=566 /DNA_ORIENTATION=-